MSSKTHITKTNHKTICFEISHQKLTLFKKSSQGQSTTWFQLSSGYWKALITFKNIFKPFSPSTCPNWDSREPQPHIFSVEELTRRTSVSGTCCCGLLLELPSFQHFFPFTTYFFFHHLNFPPPEPSPTSAALWIKSGILTATKEGLQVELGSGIFHPHHLYVLLDRPTTALPRILHTSVNSNLASAQWNLSDKTSGRQKQKLI